MRSCFMYIRYTQEYHLLQGGSILLLSSLLRFKECQKKLKDERTSNLQQSKKVEMHACSLNLGPSSFFLSFNVMPFHSVDVAEERRTIWGRREEARNCDVIQLL